MSVQSKPFQQARRRSTRLGFTLIELMAVIVIVCVITAIAMPRYAAASARYRIEASSRRLMADIAFTQARARARSINQSITFNLSKGQYQFVSLADPDRPSTTYTVDLTLEPYRSRITSASFGTGGTTLTFNGYGVPLRGGTVVLEADGLAAKVVVDADTGGISGL